MIMVVALWAVTFACGWSGRVGGEATSTTTVSEDSLTAAYPGSTRHAVPPGTERLGTVVVLHGSEGGQGPVAPFLARTLAQQGFEGFAFCWFDCEGTPQRIHHVPLDRTEQFLARVRDEVGTNRAVVLVGISRGAEHALLLASLLGETELLDGLAVHAGSDTVVTSFDPQTGRPVVGADGFDAAWTWRGEPVPGERALPWGSGPRIAIERFPGPLFLSHGERDALWPVSRTRALEGARRGLQDVVTETHYWPDDGHVLGRESTRAFLKALTEFLQTTAGSGSRVGP